MLPVGVGIAPRSLRLQQHNKVEEEAEDEADATQ